MKKILIITYYWPPKGGVGVQRWLKLTKYLVKNNYDVSIYTPDGGTSSLMDPTLLNGISENVKIVKNKIYEPNSIFELFNKKAPSSDILISKRSNFFKKILIWLRSNLFIPDSRCFWIKPSIKFLNNYLKDNQIDCIISTGPPHSMHMIALGLKKQHSIKWIADFRDPWTDIEYFDHLPLLAVNREKHKNLEKQVLSTADLILTVSESWAKNFDKIGTQKTVVLTNGYDLDDYTYNYKKQLLTQFQIGHFGVYNKLRDHSFFWDTIKKISINIPNFSSDLKLLFSGEIHNDFIKNMTSYKLFNKLKHHPYLSHGDAIKHMMKCDLLLVSQSDEKSVLGRLPAKVFEYLATRKPILVIGKKNSDLEKLVSNISYAWFVDFDNSKLLFDTILKIYKLRTLNNNFNDDISCYSREHQVNQLISLIDSL